MPSPGAAAESSTLSTLRATRPGQLSGDMIGAGASSHEGRSSRIAISFTPAFETNQPEGPVCRLVFVRNAGVVPGISCSISRSPFSDLLIGVSSLRCSFSPPSGVVLVTGEIRSHGLLQSDTRVVPLRRAAQAGGSARVEYCCGGGLRRPRCRGSSARARCGRGLPSPRRPRCILRLPRRSPSRVTSHGYFLILRTLRGRCRLGRPYVRERPPTGAGVRPRAPSVSAGRRRRQESSHRYVDSGNGICQQRLYLPQQGSGLVSSHVHMRSLCSDRAQRAAIRSRLWRRR
jgi:hypothetical protein